MTKMGFSGKWVKWIKACLQSASMSILINGSPTKEFDMEKGLRQGDPLAPFLFIIVAESLHLLMEEAVKRGMYEGLKVGMKEIQVSHLRYADDVIFFGRWSPNNLKTLFKVLKCFHILSGLKINVWKSKLYGVGVGEEEVKE